MLFETDYLRHAARLAEEGLAMGGRPGAALIRLAGQYLRYAADGLAPVNDNLEMAMGESFSHALPRPH